MHSGNDVNRLSVKRWEEWRMLVSFEDSVDLDIIGLMATLTRLMGFWFRQQEIAADQKRGQIFDKIS